MANFFIRRPIVAIVIAIVTSSLAGSPLRFCQSRSFRTLPRRKSGCKLTTLVPTAKTLEQSVATPIEQQVTGVDNMEYSIP